MTSKTADILIIGAGPAGYVAAIRLAQLGQRVIVAERARVGGVCLNRGCIPVKALLHSASIIRNAAEARTLGIRFPKPEIDLVSLGSWKNRIVERLSRGIEFLFKGNGVELIRGRAQFESPDTVLVTGEEELKVIALKVVVATGSEPAVLPGLVVDHRTIIDSNSALNLVELPRTLAVVGAGAVGLEFATIFNRLGVKVTVLEMCEQVLPGTDRELAVMLQRLLEREGIEFRLGVKGVNCVSLANMARVCWEDGAGSGEIDADKVLVAAGRKPLTDGLKLEAAGVEVDECGFVKTNAEFETNVAGIYAIGDVRGGPLVAHKAMVEGLTLAEVIAGVRRQVERKPVIPLVVYTDPELATVGLTGEQAERLGLKVRVSRVPVSAVGRALTLGRSEGICKLVADEQTGRILGVSILAPQADVLIAEAAVAVELGLTAEQLGQVVHPHPTMSELLFEAGEAVLGRAIHILNR
ncbi:MAG: dihydrolipoyl dehydrogenase [candidate division WOR-3 bacterium]|jgi:dihydrolipoamide dehydrogenase